MVRRTVSRKSTLEVTPDLNKVAVKSSAEEAEPTTYLQTRQKNIKTEFAKEHNIQH